MTTYELPTATSTIPVYAPDHAWRRIKAPGDEPGLLEGRYRCELCNKLWAL